MRHASLNGSHTEFTLPIVIGLFLSALVFTAAWIKHPHQPLAPFQVAQPSPPNELIADQSTHFIGAGDIDFVHSASITALANRDLIATWFAGPREGHPDVVIKTATYSHNEGQWASAEVLTTRKQTGMPQGRLVRKLGNPVVALAPDQKLWVFYVSVSVGGWAGSAINAMHSTDFGETWSPPQRLITSPFLNLSTLVRSSPTFHTNGDIGLPVYHEFLGKFSEYLVLDPNGRVKNKRRISKGRATLQPSIVAIDASSAIAFLRWGQRKPGVVLTSRTTDRGLTWSSPKAEPIGNPNSSIAAIGTGNPNNDILVALNDLGDGRHRLSLFKVDRFLNHWTPITVLDESPSKDGTPISPQQFKEALTLYQQHVSTLKDFLRLESLSMHLDGRVCKKSGCFFEFEYPQFTRDTNGNFHLVYSWNNGLIKHLAFNVSWLNQHGLEI